jgi:hypothetical protein
MMVMFEISADNSVRRTDKFPGRSALLEMSYNPRKRQRLSPDPKDYPFVFFGTPLPPLDPEIRDDGTFVPLWKQEVQIHCVSR